MKQKEPNRVILLQVIINASQQVREFKVGIHTPLKSLGTRLAESLNLDVFRVDIQFQYGYATYKLNESRTLAQCGIKRPKETIYANIETIHTKNLHQFRFQNNRPKTAEKYKNLSALDLVAIHPGASSQYLADGLTVEAVCVNHKCINFERELIYPLGFGTFSMSMILNTIKCNVCPYKDKNIHPVVNVRKFQFKDCRYIVSGSTRTSTGVGSLQHIQEKWTIVKGIEDVRYSEILGKVPWISAYIDIKPTKLKTKNHPFLIQPDCLQDIHYSYF